MPAPHPRVDLVGEAGTSGLGVSEVVRTVDAVRQLVQRANVREVKFDLRRRGRDQAEKAGGQDHRFHLLR